MHNAHTGCTQAHSSPELLHQLCPRDWCAYASVWHALGRNARVYKGACVVCVCECVRVNLCVSVNAGVRMLLYGMHLAAIHVSAKVCA